MQREHDGSSARRHLLWRVLGGAILVAGVSTGTSLRPTMAGEDGVSSPTVEPGGSELVSVDRVVDHDVVGMVAEAGAGRQVSATEQPASSLRAVTRGSGRPDDDGTADLPDALFLLALVGVLGLVLVGWLVGLKVILDRRHGHARPAEGEISRSRRSAP